jgi:hypothetical protein
MDVKRLNINVNGTPSAGFAGSEAIFNDVAVRVGSSLPQEYIDFIREADGGHPEIGCFFVHNSNPANSFCIDWFYSFSNPGIESIHAALNGWGEIVGGKCLPIARDAGGNQFYLDLREATPSVWLYLHDESGARVLLAETFEKFISGLTVHPDFI